MTNLFFRIALSTISIVTVSSAFFPFSAQAIIMDLSPNQVTLLKNAITELENVEDHLSEPVRGALRSLRGTLDFAMQRNMLRNVTTIIVDVQISMERLQTYLTEGTYAGPNVSADDAANVAASITAAISSLQSLVRRPLHQPAQPEQAEQPEQGGSWCAVQ
jgi:hypothetical protein